ncbi:MAG: hypothetical protein E6I76_20690 [Chloroflexi bacterium]|nr:MAG: hypothetical protein E6I76_20690 [Chloroflexota bacterium]
MSDLIAALPGEARERLRSCPQPEWVPPMLATLTQRRFSSPDWIFERKLDGERCLAFVRVGAVRLLSRNRRRLEGTYPEVVAFEEGRTSFARLQGRLGITVHRNAEGERFVDEACRQGWEGLIGKRADAAYVGRRSADWLKLKCSNRQEMVVGGFTEPMGSRVGFGALLTGYHDEGRLVDAGKEGTGYDTATLRELRDRLEQLEQPQSPFAGGAGREAGAMARESRG